MFIRTRPLTITQRAAQYLRGIDDPTDEQVQEALDRTRHVDPRGDFEGNVRKGTPCG